MDLELALQRRGHLEEFRRKHRAGLPALLSTDIVGSTRLKQELDRLSVPDSMEEGCNRFRLSRH